MVFSPNFISSFSLSLFALLLRLLLCNSEKDSSPSSSSSSYTTFYDKNSNITTYTKDFYKCPNLGEIFSGSYLVTRKYFQRQVSRITLPIENINRTNIELATFAMINQQAIPFKFEYYGTPLQSRDLLDFSVIHLSAYERLFKEHPMVRKHLGVDGIRKMNHNIMKGNHKERLERDFPTSSSRSSGSSSLSPFFLKTLVIMPYLGESRGISGSMESHRPLYLSTCFWSFYRYFPNIVAGVISRADSDEIK